MPNAPGGSVTGYGFCFPFGPMATILRAAGTTTSPVLVAAAETGPASAGNTDSTLICTPLAAPCADTTPSEASTTHTAARHAAAKYFFMKPSSPCSGTAAGCPGRHGRPFRVRPRLSQPLRERSTRMKNDVLFLTVRTAMRGLLMTLVLLTVTAAASAAPPTLTISTPLPAWLAPGASFVVGGSTSAPAVSLLSDGTRIG